MLNADFQHILATMKKKPLRALTTALAKNSGTLADDNQHQQDTAVKRPKCELAEYKLIPAMGTAAKKLALKLAPRMAPRERVVKRIGQ